MDENKLWYMDLNPKFQVQELQLNVENKWNETDKKKSKETN